VKADRDRVGQVLMNFVSNALKYSPNGGDVVISARHVGSFVNVSVQDHGMGITREDQKQLFTKFYRIDNALTREIGGTGLGLSICKSIIELHGGKVGVRSKMGEGSTFTFSLPVAPRELVRTPYLQGPAAVGGKILVVDRDPEVADLIETYLVKRGYEVIQAHSAAEALDKAVKERPLVITLDVILDSGDGFELLQALKDQPETAAIPVVVLSIVCDEGKSCRLGAADYLEKPIDQTRLLRIIDSFVGSAKSPVALVVDDDRRRVQRTRGPRGDREAQTGRHTPRPQDARDGRLPGHQEGEDGRGVEGHPHHRHDRTPHRQRTDRRAQARGHAALQASAPRGHRGSGGGAGAHPLRSRRRSR
jgi:CheY-like chemotaxis protein